MIDSNIISDGNCTLSGRKLLKLCLAGKAAVFASLRYVLYLCIPTHWKEVCIDIPDCPHKKLDFHPATFEIVEHHVAVYCGNKNQTIVRAGRPSKLLKNSIVTPSFLAAVLNTKYINSVSLYRLEQEFKRYDVNISRQVMSNWVITGSERYLSLLYDRMHDELYRSHVLHVDELCRALHNSIMKS